MAIRTYLMWCLAIHWLPSVSNQCSQSACNKVLNELKILFLPCLILKWNIIILLIGNFYIVLQLWSLFFGYEATYISCTTHYKKSCIDDIFCLGNLSCGLAPLDYCLALYWRRKNRSWKRMLHTVYLQVWDCEYNMSILITKYRYNLFLLIHCSNEYMSIVTVVIAFFAPVSVMIGLYVRVWWETVKRQRELVHLQAGKKASSKRSDSR